MLQLSNHNVGRSYLLVLIHSHCDSFTHYFVCQKLVGNDDIKITPERENFPTRWPASSQFRNFKMCQSSTFDYKTILATWIFLGVKTLKFSLASTFLIYGKYKEAYP